MSTLLIQSAESASRMQTVYDLTGLREMVGFWRREGHSIAFVPTMGNLHGGHLSLLERARQIADRTVVSVFVNPIQFGAGEDYHRYPSTLREDSAKLNANGLDLLFAPDLSQLYPAGTEADTRVTVPEISNILCGQFRPGHFSGVATVVTKLLINVQPDVALFGEKDYQQLLVIRRLVEDLCIPVDIVGMPIVREPDGLAMSSRNAYLDEIQRRTAPVIYRTLLAAADRLRRSPGAIVAIESEGTSALQTAGLRPEYFSVRRSEDLGVPRAGDRRLSILTAAWLGKARLIDNVKVRLD
jgi:pantoate--beta-alanine ligase